jgi:hypothetical protein
MPAHPAFLRSLLQRAAPSSIGLSRPAWNNARLLMYKTLEWTGLASIPGHYQAPLSSTWAALAIRLPPDTALSYQLSRFFHYASAQSIEPDDITDKILESFYQALMEESVVRLRPTRSTAALQNRGTTLSTAFRAGHNSRLTVPSRARVFSLPWNAFPPGLEVSVEIYLRRAAGLDLSDDHFRRPQRPATIDTRRKQLRLFATAIVRSGIVLDSLVDLRAMLVPEVAADGLRYLVDRNGGASNVHISNLADFLPTLAARLDMPEATIGRLRTMKRKLKVTQHGMTACNREALRAFDDPAAVEALLSLPQRILREVQARVQTTYRLGRFDI